MLDEPEGIPKPNSHKRIHRLVQLIPKGQVASYGMVASLLTGVTARLVGFAMAGLPPATDIPWHRVINASGGISPRPGAQEQFDRLKAEGFEFTRSGKLDWRRYAWDGPDASWCEVEDIPFEEMLVRMTGWPVRDTD